MRALSTGNRSEAMIGAVLNAMLLGLGAFAILVMAVEFARRPLVIAYGLLAVHFWQLLAAVPSLRISGVGFGPVDAVNLVAFGATAIRMRRPRGLQWPLVAVAAMVLVAVARAVLTFGTGNALLGFRAELYFIVPALFASTLKAHEVAGVLRGLWRFGFWMAVVAAARWFLLGFGIDVGPAPNPDGYEIARVINAGATLTVGAAAAMGTRRWLHDKTARWYTPFVILGMLLVVLLAQNRSVWVATTAMLIVVFAGATGRVWLRAGAALALGGSVVLVELLGLGATGTVAGSLAYAASNTGTWTWRLQRWQDVWSTHAARGPGAIVFGSGYGHAWVSGAIGVWQVSPHDGYIQIAVRIGLVGAVLLFGTYAFVVARLGRRVDTPSRIVQVLTVGVLVYCVPYSYDIWTGLLLGASVALVMAHAQAPHAGPELRRRPTPARVPAHPPR